MRSQPLPDQRQASLPRLVALFLMTAATAAGLAQTTLAPSLMAPANAYNRNTPGFVVRSHQITAARTPGDANSIANLERELSGRFGPSVATPGPNADGSYNEATITYFNGTPPFPGIDFATRPTNFVLEVITYLDLPTGTNRLAVSCNDSFRLTMGVGDNPRTVSAVQPAGAVRNGSGAQAEFAFDVVVQTAGVYPVRLIYGQGEGEAVLDFYAYDGAGVRWDFNDPFNPAAPKAYRPATLPIVPAKSYVSYVQPLPGENNVSPQPTIAADLQDAGTIVNKDQVTLSLDGATVGATVVKSNSVTTVTYTPTLVLASGTHTATLVWRDTAGTSATNTWQFTVATYFFIPASWSYPLGSQNPSAPGFAARIVQPRQNAGLSSTISVGNQLLEGSLIDTTTGQPFTNLVANTTSGLTPGLDWFGNFLVAPDGTFTETNFINYSIDAGGAAGDLGNFNLAVDLPDAVFPGLPGATDATRTAYQNLGNFAIEELCFVELTAGLHTLVVRARDSAEIAFHANDARDIFRTGVVRADTNQGPGNRQASVLVESNGLYAVRVMHQAYINSTPFELEFYEATTNGPVLINQRTNAASLKAWRSLAAPARPYIRRLTPGLGATGIAETSSVQVVMVNLGTLVPTLSINGTPVSYTATTNGNEVTLTHTPAAPFAKASLVSVQVQYGPATANSSFVTKAAGKALMIVGGAGTDGDKLIAQRLALVHGMDVQIIADATASQTGSTNNAAGCSLILTSSSALAGNNPLTGRGWELLPIPIINWEQAYADDLKMLESGQGTYGGQTQLKIVGAGHPLAAGFTNSTYAFSTTAYEVHYVNAPANAVLIATDMNATPRGLLWGLEKDGVVTAGGTPFAHPAKRLHLGFAGNSGLPTWTPEALALFDAAITWMVPPAAKPPQFNAPVLAGGQVTLSWTGTGTLEETTSLTPTISWSPSPSQANPQNVPATGNRFYRIRQ